jgi:hypothetical protein
MSTVRFLSLFALLVAVVGICVVFGEENVDLEEKATDRRLESLRKDLIGARKHNADDSAKEVSESRSLTDLLDGLNPEEELLQKKISDKNVKDDEEDDDDDDEDDDDPTNGKGVSDTIFYIVFALADKINKTCKIDISTVLNTFSPATLANANDAITQIGGATKDLNSLLASAPGFADELKTFAESSTFKASDVAAQINKTFAQMDKTLSSVSDKLFCANAKLIVLRLQMALYGGVGFANGYLCNKVFVELIRYQLNATKLLKASTDDKNFVQNCTRSLVEDVTCYEKELEAYYKITPKDQFTASSPLQTAAFTADFLNHYGVVMLYHRIILQLEGEIIKLCASGKNEDDDDNEVDRNTKEAEDVGEETEKLTNQLQKLLQKLNEVSAKKKEAEMALAGHINDRNVDAADKRSMPSAAEKTELKESYYRGRAN